MLTTIVSCFRKCFVLCVLLYIYNLCNMKGDDDKHKRRNGTIASDSIIIIQRIFNNYGVFTYYCTIYVDACLTCN